LHTAQNRLYLQPFGEVFLSRYAKRNAMSTVLDPVSFVESQKNGTDLPTFQAGDTVAVHYKIREGNKERTQVFQGVVLQRRNPGANETFTVRKISNGIGVERIFPSLSPFIEKVDVISRGVVRRARLFYLRAAKGKKARIKTRIG